MTVTASVSAGSVATQSIYWSGTATAPGYSVAYQIMSSRLTTRCDNKAVKGSVTAGCVMDGATGTAVFGAAVDPAFTRHVRDAISSGLPSTLTWRYNAAANSASRAVACPSSSSLPRPPGTSCDEYPFASTYEGATKGQKARTFSWCKTTGNLTGAAGFSRCMIVADQNRHAGSILQQQYLKLRYSTATDSK